MQNGTETTISKIKFYDCGYCVNDLGHMYRKTRNKKVRFYARVMLITHKTKGNILVDTGYSRRIYNGGWMSAVYNLINPATVTDEDHIRHLLAGDGIRASQIKQIVLTHLHPDHIGAINDFPSTPLVMSEACGMKLKGHNIRDLIMTNQIDVSVLNRTRLVPLQDLSPLDGFMGTDLLGDGSVWLVELEGHAKGQLGVYIPSRKLLYVADALWGMEMIDHTLRLIPRVIQNNYRAYKETIKKIKALQDIEVISTHGGEVLSFEE